MDEQLTDRTTIVTGASSGIGAATARTFAAAGANVVLAARSEQSLRDLAANLETEYDVRAVPVPTDVTDYDAVAGLVETTRERLGTIDVVVANAGIGEQRDQPIADMPLDQYRQVTRTNIDGAFYTTKASLSALKQNNGALVYVGSYLGKHPSTSIPVYAATKWWLQGFAHSVAGRTSTVGVSLVNPSGVRTAFGSEYNDEANEQRLDTQTLSPAEVADSIAFSARMSLDTRSAGVVAELDLYRTDINSRF